ncbi:S9 family peptidase [Sphingomonas sp.]|uniref:S9 family peptidase n=1 Tax=Sphingomonas sp. TaxID=28214 RepID=UPI002C431DFC|nr:S9 family peptidase [Sphingomonas sp.]HWK36386.1 S9 family peptidase [Sphingomonas sp.]
MGLRAAVTGAIALLVMATSPAAVTPAALAQSGTPLRIEQIYGPDAVTLDRPLASKWLGAGDRYTTLEKSPAVDGGVDIVRYDTASGRRSILVDARALVPPGAARPLAVADYGWSPDGRTLMVQTRAPAARRNNPIGDYWLFDLGSHTLRRLGQGLPAESLLYATFAPDGSRIAYVSGNNLYVEAVAGAGPVRLTDDGDEHILNGRSDVVYEEEFRLGKAFQWSPDSRRIAYWQFDTRGVGTFYMIRNTDGQYSQPVPQQYPKPGTTNSAVRVGVVAADAPGTTWFALQGDPRNMYVPRMDWAGNAGELLIQHENRLQNTNHVMIGDAATGAVRELMTERDDAWLLPNDEVHWLDGGKKFTWLSERDGWRHLYVVSRDGAGFDLRTPGDFDVVSVELIDEKAGQVYFIAAPDNVTQRYLYRASLTGAPRLTRLTPAAAAGTHDYDLAPGAKWAFHTFSTVDTPPVIDVVALPDHKRARVMADNPRMRALLAATPHRPTEFFKVDIGGGTVLDAWMMKPPAFDPGKKYPMLVYVYSEPAGQTVADRWGGDRYLWHMMLAQQGYLVASVDSRGAAAPRGRAWRKGIYRQVGIQASADQAAAVQRMMAERPYIDPARIGVWGWSGGGAMTLNALFRYPDLYKAGIAVAGPSNQLLYNSIYQERYMGLPDDNAAGYRDGSPINFAQNLKGDLLIVHGTGDDNVHYQNSEQLIDRLIALNKPFQMMAYPNRTHGISEGANTRLHLFTMATRYLNDHLPAGGK